MIRTVRLVPLLLVLAIGTMATGVTHAQVIDALIAQLEGRGCRYSDSAQAPCTETTKMYGWFWRLDPISKYRCTRGAALCLGHLGPAAQRAVPALIRALANGPNDYDTGDGFIAARSAVADALGLIGDTRAIEPLAEALAHAKPADRGAGAMASSEPAARSAIITALGRFGPAAGGQWQAVAAVLRARNADTAFLASRREQYERSAALDLAIADHRRRDPQAVSLEVSEASIRESRPRLDPSSSEYRRAFESASYDRLAVEAATALGAFGRTEAAPLLVETLSNPPSAEAAAGALAALGERSGAALEALERVIADSTGGPLARAAAAAALGKLGDESSAPTLAGGLFDPEIGRSVALGLAALGPRAASALPMLVARLGQLIPAQRTARGATYDLDATRQLGEKTAVVRAIESIGGRRAMAALEPFERDPDVGSHVRKALARMERTPAR